jgi:large subunit ribosomal protein L5
MTRLQEKYLKEVAPALREEFGYKNPHQVPKIVKVVVNAGAGRATGDARVLEHAMETLTTITGQKPVATVARKSIASFKLREGNKIGAMVTLRGARAQEFIDQLVSVALPRVRDFRGISVEAFDPFGNYSLGLSDQTIFPQINIDDNPVPHGLQINVVTSAKTADEGRRLLALLGFPFRRNA